MKLGFNAVLSCFVILIIVVVMTIANGKASSVLEVSLDEMLQQSQLVFEGTVTAINAKEDSQKRIHTYVTFEINDIIKGKYPGNTLTLRFLGGTVDGLTMTVSDMRLPQQGEHGIYFVESVERYQVNPLYGWSQGHFIVERDDTGIGRITTNRRLPVVGVMDYTPEEKMTQGEERQQALSKGVARDIVVAKEGKGSRGITLDEFKQALHKRMEKSQ